MGKCHEKEHYQLCWSVLNNALCLRDFNKFSFYHILDDVSEKNEHPTEPDDSNAEYDPIQAASKIS